MKKFDREDKLLLIISGLLFVLSLSLIFIGLAIYPNQKWDGVYVFFSASSIIFFIFALLSLIMKKYKENKK